MRRRLRDASSGSSCSRTKQPPAPQRSERSRPGAKKNPGDGNIWAPPRARRRTPGGLRSLGPRWPAVRIADGGAAGAPPRGRAGAHPRGAGAAAHRALARRTAVDARLQSAAEWFLDNYYLIRRIARQVEEELPRGFVRHLPRLADDPARGRPRIDSLAAAAAALAAPAPRAVRSPDPHALAARAFAVRSWVPRALAAPAHASCPLAPCEPAPRVARAAGGDLSPSKISTAARRARRARGSCPRPRRTARAAPTRSLCRPEPGSRRGSNRPSLEAGAARLAVNACAGRTPGLGRARRTRFLLGAARCSASHPARKLPSPATARCAPYI